MLYDVLMIMLILCLHLWYQFRRYGDMVPETIAGKIVGGVCSLSGGISLHNSDKIMSPMFINVLYLTDTITSETTKFICLQCSSLPYLSPSLYRISAESTIRTSEPINVKHNE